MVFGGNLHLDRALDTREMARNLSMTTGWDRNKIGLVLGERVAELKQINPEAAKEACQDELEGVPPDWRRYVEEFTWAKLAADSLLYEHGQAVRHYSLEQGRWTYEVPIPPPEFRFKHAHGGAKLRPVADATKERSEDEGWTEIE